MKNHGKRIIDMTPRVLTSRIQNEPMLFGADVDFADVEGGILTTLALMALEDIGVDRTNMIVDTRSHMLKPGWFPAIPGWHCDEFPRGKDGQPDIDLIPGCHDDRPRHYLIILDAGTQAMTHFLSAKCRGYMALDEGLIAHKKAVQAGFTDSTVWGQCDKVIRQAVHPEHIEPALSGHLYEFGQFDFHTATSAKLDGWRWFFRATTKSKRPVANEIRRQVQVYLGDVNGGW